MALDKNTVPVNVVEGSPEAIAWEKTGPKMDLTLGEITQNIAVQVAGHELKPAPAIAGGIVKPVLPSTIEITWPNPPPP